MTAQKSHTYNVKTGKFKISTDKQHAEKMANLKKWGKKTLGLLKYAGHKSKLNLNEQCRLELRARRSLMAQCCLL